MTYTIAALYRFVPITDTAALRSELKIAFAALDLCGTLLIAPEGINGTLAGHADAIDHMLAVLAQQTGLARDEVKFSSAPDRPFNRLKIRLKREIITFNQPAADPAQWVGAYVMPKDWNKLISDPDVVVVDTRNMYETAIGKFSTAHDPQIERFYRFCHLCAYATRSRQA